MFLKLLLKFVLQKAFFCLRYTRSKIISRGYLDIQDSFLIHCINLYSFKLLFSIFLIDVYFYMYINILQLPLDSI